MQRGASTSDHEVYQCAWDIALPDSCGRRMPHTKGDFTCKVSWQALMCEHVKHPDTQQIKNWVNTLHNEYCDPDTCHLHGSWIRFRTLGTRGDPWWRSCVGAKASGAPLSQTGSRQGWVMPSKGVPQQFYDAAKKLAATSLSKSDPMTFLIAHAM